MITKDRLEHVSQEDEQVKFTCLAPSDHGSHNVSEVKTFTWPSFTRNYEKMTPNSHYGGVNDWKNFEHFRSVQGNFSGSLMPIYSEQWGNNPHVFRGFSASTQAGYHLYWSGSELEPYGTPGALNNGLQRWDVTMSDGHFVPAPTPLDELVSHSLRVMMPGIKAELSLINSVIELKDFRSYLTLLKGAKSKIKYLAERIPSMLKNSMKSPGKVIRSLPRKAASAFLSWKFAFEPLLSDISSIHSALTRTERRMNDLVTRAGKRQRRHFTFYWVESPDSFETNGDPGFVQPPGLFNTIGLYNVERRVINKPTIFHAEIEYNYNFTQYQLEHARVLSYLDALGINPNPAIVWNALPWSFVVDWVFGVSRWLDSMKTRNMEPLINILRYLWSVKRERNIVCTKGISTSYYGLPPLARTHLPVVTETAYRRECGIPEWNSFYTSGISSEELTLGAALVIARSRRRNTRLYSRT